MIASGHESTKMLKVRNGWLGSSKAQQASPIWRGIEKARGVLSKGACYIISNGQKVRVWEDPWCLG